MTKLRVPLDKWHEDMERIAGDWDGKSSAFNSGGTLYVEEQAHLAGEAAKLIEELEVRLNALGY